MSGGNVTIGQFNTTTTAPVAGDSFAAYQATASATVQFLATQLLQTVFKSTATIAVAGVATLPSGPVGFIVVSLNGTNVKLPYYTV